MNRSPDRDWIRSIVHEYEGPLTLYATRLAGDVERGRDVVQETFLRLWQADRATVDGHVAQWLYTVCRNRALDVRRKEQRMTTLNDHQAETAAPVPPPQDAGEAARETTCGMLVLISHLPERQQEVVRLKFQGGLSYREIAEVMDTTANNVGVLLHTAIKTIRQTLADQAAAGSKA